MTRCYKTIMKCSGLHLKSLHLLSASPQPASSNMYCKAAWILRLPNGPKLVLLKGRDTEPT